MYLDGPNRLLFVANQGNATMSVVDLRVMEVTDIQPVGDDPDVLAFDPALHRLYVATEGGGLWVYQSVGRRLVVEGVLNLPHAHTGLRDSLLPLALHVRGHSFRCLVPPLMSAGRGECLHRTQPYGERLSRWERLSEV